MEIAKLMKIIYGNKTVGVQHLRQLSTKLTEETTNTSVISDLPKLMPAVFKYAVHEDRSFREAALPALTELAGLLDLNKHLKEKPWWTEMKGEILKSVDVLMNLVSTGDDQWSVLWMTTVLMLGSDLRSELTLLNRLLKVVEKAFKMNDEEVRHQGFECWCKLIDNFSINKQEINNKRRLSLLVIPLKANNHNTPRLCSSKMKTWKHLLSKLDQHNEMTVQLLVTHFLEFMFSGVGSIAPACKSLNFECANIFSQMLQTNLLFRILPKVFIKHTFVCIEHVYRDMSLSLSVWEGLLDNLKNNQWAETYMSELMIGLTDASNNEKLGKSKTFAHMIRMLYSGSHALSSDTLLKHLKTILSLALEPHFLDNYTEAWCNELLDIVAKTDPIQLPQNIIGDITTKLNVLAVSELFRDEKLKFLRGMWMTLTNMVCKWMADDGQIGKNGTVETDLHNIHQLLFFGTAPLSSTWNKLQMKSWKSLYSECVKYFSLSTEVKCEKFVGDLVELLLEGVKDKQIPLHVAIDLVSIILECHLSKDESSVLPLMMEVATSTMGLFQTDTAGALALLSHYLRIIMVAARNEPALVNDILTVVDKMLTLLETTPLIEGHIEKTRNVILKAQIQLNSLKPSRSQDKSESPGSTNLPPATSPTMTSFLHRLAKSKETKSKVGSPTPSQSSDVSSSPSHTPKSKKASSPFCDMKSEDFVFVPPKPRKILLTDHQKETLSTRKHDIPALYQDLSQDSSQSPFESIVAPVQAMDKEQLENGTIIHSPNNFKEVNFRSMSPKKSPITNLKQSSSEDKLQNNKENDCINNNTKSPIKTNLKEIKSSGGTEDVPLKVLQDDQKRSQDQIPENFEISKVIPANTRQRSRKSLANDSNDNHSLIIEECTKTATSDLHVNGEDTESDSIVMSKKHVVNDVGNKNCDKITANPDNTEVKNEDAVHNVTTPKQSVTEAQTPKRSLRKNKLNISFKKSVNKNKPGNKGDEDKNEKANSSVPDTTKSPSSISTQKVSPRRLRKRKSGVTPVLTGGEFIKKLRKSQSPLNHTPALKTNKSLGNDGTPSSTKSDNNLSKSDSIVLNHNDVETPKQTDEKPEIIKDINKSVSKSAIDKSKSASKNGIEKIKSTSASSEEDIIKSAEGSENKSDVSSEDSGEVEIIAVIKGNKTETSSNIKSKNKVDLNMLDDGCKQIPAKSLMRHKDDAPAKSLMQHKDDVPTKSLMRHKDDAPAKSLMRHKDDVVYSPVKVVVERLPEIILSANHFEIQEERKSLSERMKNIEIAKIRGKSAKNLAFSIEECELESKGVEVSSIIKSANTESRVVVTEEKSVTLPLSDTCAQKLDETCTERKDLNKSINNVHEENALLTNDDSDNKSERGNKSVGKVQSEQTGKSCHRRTRSMNTSETTLDTEKSNEKVKAKSEEEALVNDTKEDSVDFKSTPVKKVCSLELKLPSVSTVKTSESGKSPSTPCKQKSSENTPSKSGQKQFKQTQLPFTPIPKTLVSESKEESSENQNSPTNPDEKGEKSPSLVLTRVEASETNEDVHSTKLKSENKKETIHETEPTIDSNNEFNEDKVSEMKAESELSPPDKMPGTRQVLRTPEKASTSTTMVLCLQRTEVEITDKSNTNSPDKFTESEDVIGSSQETDVITQSILVSYKNSGPANSLKLLSKSPKKCESASQVENSSERFLRSSPNKTENSRFAGTPVKKSVCRRLDVEIEESPDVSDLNSSEGKLLHQNSEELSDDFKLLNGESGTSTNIDDHSLPSNRVSEVVEDTHSASVGCSHKNLKRYIVESDVSCVGSPKRTVSSLRLEDNVSPISSPNSRTSQMMELLKQEKERTISSPISSTKRRRILPIRVGPVTRTPRSHIIQRSHHGPSEEWVRRTYSPTASPNSSILKRLPPISPDSSPPCSKKKRVSFLDPPVSESLLFSKANPGKGQIQRPEPKQENGCPDMESEEQPSQGSVTLEVPQTSNSDAKVFSPLKQCSSPLTDILERIVNLQWMSELEVQLERLGVTTVGQLSSLPEETIQRLPFIPPKLERLRKILQNYYNEINEKPVNSRPTASKEQCFPPGKDGSEVPTESPEKNVEDPEPSSGGSESSDEDISFIAENIKHKIEQHPELIGKLGNMLHIDVVMKLLDFAVCKLKKENDKS